MRLSRAFLLAGLLAALVVPALAGERRIEIRTEDAVYLKDGGGKLEGEIQSETERELRIKIKGSGAVRVEPTANVDRIVRRQNIKQAFDACMKASVDAKDAPALRSLAAELLELNPGMSDEAISALTAACEIKPDYGPAHLLLGRIYLDRGFNTKAAEEGEAAVKALPKDGAAHVLLGTALVRLGEAEKALAALNAALDEKGGVVSSTNVKIAAATGFAEAGDMATAMKLVADIADNNPTAQLAAGTAFLRAGDLKQAAGFLDKAAQSKELRSQGEPHLALAATYYLQGDTDMASREANQIPIYNDARDAAPLALKALISLRKGETDKADLAIKRAMVSDPSRARVATVKAVIEISKNNLDEAAKALDDVAAKPSCTDAYVHYLLGYVLYRKGDYAKSLAAYLRAAKLAPRWPDALLGAGASALAGRNFQAAAKSFDEALKIDQESAAAHVGLGLACLGLPGRDDDASKELRRALAIDARCVSAHLGLGYLANKRKSESEALAAFERAIGLDGGNAYAADAINKLRAGRGEEVQYYAFEENSLPKGWAPEQRFGVTIASTDGRLLFSGKQKVAGGQGYETRFLIRIEPSKFARLDMDVECAPTGSMDAGLFLSGGSGAGDLEVFMTQAGKIGWRKRDAGGWSETKELGEWPKGEGGAAGKLRLAIEQVDADRGSFRVYVGGRVFDQEIIVGNMMLSRGYALGAFCRAQKDDDIRVGFDNACLVTRKPKPEEPKPGEQK